MLVVVGWPTRELEGVWCLLEVVSRAALGMLLLQAIASSAASTREVTFQNTRANQGLRLNCVVGLGWMHVCQVS